jgi:asparagine synthase (glutamine-hydrolysing)
MLARSSDVTGLETIVLAKEGAGLAVSPPDQGAAFADHEVLAAVDGRPTYSDIELNQIAQREGPAAALVVGYRKMGNRVLQVLHGSFCLAIVNYKEESAFLAVDRLAIRSMTATVADQCLVFGSSAQAIRRLKRTGN